VSQDRSLRVCDVNRVCKFQEFVMSRQCTTDRARKIPFEGSPAKAIYKSASRACVLACSSACIGTLPPFNESLVTTRVGRYVSIYGQTYLAYVLLTTEYSSRTKPSRALRIQTREKIYRLPRPMFSRFLFGEEIRRERTNLQLHDRVRSRSRLVFFLARA